MIAGGGWVDGWGSGMGIGMGWDEDVEVKEAHRCTVRLLCYYMKIPVYYHPKCSTRCLQIP